MQGTKIKRLLRSEILLSRNRGPTMSEERAVQRHLR